jgi:threonine synthase
MKNVLKAVCISCGAEYEAGDTTCTCTSCGSVLEIVYDYDYIKTVFTKEKLAERRDPTLFRYRELLPIEDGSDLTPLRVGGSPLYRAEKLGKILGLTNNLYIKDDGLNPTSSLKDRASAIAVVRAKKAGVPVVACSSTGNAASSLAGNAAALGLKAFIFVPERAPKGKLIQLLMFGANVISVKGNYEDTFKLSAQAIEKWGWYNRNAAINPYLSEGKKTVSLEIAEQLGFKSPDYVAISVGDGCTIAGVWKGFKDLFAIGFIDKLPRLISVQASGCCPINRAIETGQPLAPMEENTIADSIAVGVPRNGEKALRAIRESKGITVNVSDEEILASMRLLGATTGVFGEPAGVTGTAGLKKAVEQGLVPPDALVVSVVTGNGLKDVVSAQRAAAEASPSGEPGSLEPIQIPADLDLLIKEFERRKITP